MFARVSNSVTTIDYENLYRTILCNANLTIFVRVCLHSYKQLAEIEEIFLLDGSYVLILQIWLRAELLSCVLLKSYKHNISTPHSSSIFRDSPLPHN